MGCGCNKGRANTGTVSTAKTVAGAGPLFEVLDGPRIVWRTRDENAAKTRADSIPNGRYRPAGAR